MNQWVSAVVRVGWQSLAVGTEVRVVADSTLVANAHDMLASIFLVAKRTVTVDAHMNWCASRVVRRKMFIDGSKAMPRMALVNMLEAG